MTKLVAYIVTGLNLCVLSCFGEGVSSTQTATKNDSSPTQEKYDIMRRNEIDDTDVLAIPFDDSEVEDEEEINQAEKKEVFSLPYSR
jgi:hypothetical protein